MKIFELQLRNPYSSLENKLADDNDLLIWFNLLHYVHVAQLRSRRKGQLSYQHTDPGKPPRCSLPVLGIHSLAIHRQLLFLNQRKRKSGHRNIFMTKSSRKNVPDTGYNLDTACISKRNCYRPSYHTQYQRQCKIQCTARTYTMVRKHAKC